MSAKRDALDAYLQWRQDHPKQDPPRRLYAAIAAAYGDAIDTGHARRTRRKPTGAQDASETPVPATDSGPGSRVGECRSHTLGLGCSRGAGAADTGRAEGAIKAPRQPERQDSGPPTSRLVR